MSAPFQRPEDMSREELVRDYNEMLAGMMRIQNCPSLQRCPFCFGTTQVPLIKVQVKEDLIKQWHTDVTRDEWHAYWLSTYPPPSAKA